MKRYFILAAASVVALAACTKQTMDTTPDKEIAFQVAKYVNATKAEGDKVIYNPAATFGTYAIFTNGTAAEAKDDFMSNVEIGLTGNTWAPLKNAYYWPKTGTLDFVSYSPYASAWIAPVIEGHAYTKLVANGVTPAHTFADGKEYTVDLMYSDVALKCKSNSSTNLDGDPSTNYAAGVPTLFRHALSKLNFNVVLTYNDVKSGADQNEIYTSWEVKVKSMTIKNVAQKGSLTLTGFNEAGVWNLPASKVWTPSTEVADIALVDAADPKELSTTAESLLSDYYVMPQALGENTTLAIEFEIKTYRYASSKGAGNYDKTADLFLTETAKVEGIKISDAFISTKTDTKIGAWEISKNYTYSIRIAPAKIGDDGDDTKPDTITFDPATADWTPVAGVIKVTL